jgi:hypothetical protein
MSKSVKWSILHATLEGSYGAVCLASQGKPFLEDGVPDFQPGISEAVVANTSDVHISAQSQAMRASLTDGAAQLLSLLVHTQVRAENLSLCKATPSTNRLS